MNVNNSLEVRISGRRGTEPLSPSTVGVSYLISALGATRDLLSGEMIEGQDAVVIIEEGSLALRYHSGVAPTKLTASLSAIDKARSLAAADRLVRRGIEALLDLARRNGDTVAVTQAGNPVLTLTPETVFQDPPVNWVESEVYVRGVINNAGGVTRSNLHLETDDPRFGKLTVNATRAQLAGDEKNRLYKPQTLRLRMLQDPATGGFDLGSAELIEFVETQAITDVGGYVDRLIASAKNTFSALGDKEKWLAEIRGHEG